MHIGFHEIAKKADSMSLEALGVKVDLCGLRGCHHGGHADEGDQAGVAQ